MPTWVWILIAVLALVAIAAVVWAWRERRSRQLRNQFGPEYERTVREAGGRRQAESELEERRRRREDLDIRPLDPASRERYAEAWREVQSQFVDAPEAAVTRADALVIEVMRERGYPMEDFEARAADVSVDHPNVVQNYRRAHDISAANARGEAGTEDLRQAMVHYRELFEDLLNGDVGTVKEAR